MLSSVLDDGITRNIVRLGSRSTDERIAQYSLMHLERLEGSKSLDRTMQREYAIMKKLEEDMRCVMNSIQLPHIEGTKANEFLSIHYPEADDALQKPPFWIAALADQLWEDEAAHGRWESVGAPKIKGPGEDPTLHRNFYAFWKDARDIEFIQVPLAPLGTDEASKDPRREFFISLGFTDLPRVPARSRPTEALLQYTEGVWGMSVGERGRLAAHWEDDIRKLAYQSNLDEFEALCQQYKAACKQYNDVSDEVRKYGIGFAVPRS